MEVKTNGLSAKLKKISKALSQYCSIKVGLLSGKGGEKDVTENMDLAGLGAVHEFGADFEHPGGTPYFINEWGMATFVKKDSFYGQLLIKRGQVTKPHNISIPSRSWLQMPLSRNNGKDLMKKIAETQIDEQFVKDILFVSEDPKKSAKEIAEIIGDSALMQIMEAFASRGFDEWAPNRPETIARKGSEDPLIDIGTLRRAITYEVEENG